MPDKTKQDNDTRQASDDKTSQTHDMTPQSDKAVEPTKSSERTYSDKELSELVEKARAEEKNKVYSKLESFKSEKEKILSNLEELREAKKQLEADRDSLREGRASDLKSVNEELSQLREQNEKLQQAIDATVENSSRQIREHELRAYKADKIREAGLKLTELVSGSSEEEIETAIKAAKKREDEIAEQVREQVKKELAGDLPRPISTDSSRGRGPDPQVNVQDRMSVARLPRDEYLKRRAQLLSDARIKAGLE